MPSCLRRSTPADQRVDPAAILSFLDAVDERPDIEMHSLMVVRHGRVVAEGWWAPYSAGRPQLLYSLSKSFTSTAAAFAQAEGLLDLDDTVISHFPEFAADITDPRSRSMKVRHVASMAAGHTREMLGEAIKRDREEPVRGFLLIPPDGDPARCSPTASPARTRWPASSSERGNGPHPLPAAPVVRPARHRARWVAYLPAWAEQGFSGVHARTEDIAKLGLLHAQGPVGGTQVIRERVAERHRSRSATRAKPALTGGRATATSSGCPGTDTAATEPSGSSA